MPRKPSSFLTVRAGALLLSALLASASQAAELGDITVRSYIGQQLSADIELVALAPEELNGLPVRLALPDVFSGANIRMNPVLASVHMAVVRREQRQFVHLTTLQPVDSSYLHLFLELGGGGRQVVRAATLWLQPDPRPAPPAAPEPAPASVALAPRLAAPSEPSLPVQRVPLRPAPPARPPRLPVEKLHAEPVAPPLKVSKPVCLAQSGERAKECAVLDSHNAALSSKIVELESKIKSMQLALAAPPAHAPAVVATAAPKAAPEAGPAAAGQAPASASAAAAEPAVSAASASASASAAAAEAAEPAKPARASAAASHASAPKLKWRDQQNKPPEPGMKLSTRIAAGSAVFLLVVGLAVHLLGRRKKAGKALMPALRWPGKKAAPDPVQAAAAAQAAAVAEVAAAEAGAPAAAAEPAVPPLRAE